MFNHPVPFVFPGRSFSRSSTRLSVLAPAVRSLRRPTALHPRVVPRRRSAAPRGLLVTAATPSRLQTGFTASYSGFCLTACSAVDCVIDWLNQVFVFIHPMATFSSVLSAAKEPRLQFCCGGVVRGAPSSSAPKYEMSLPQCQVFICYDKATMRVRNVWFSPLAPQPTVRVPCVTSKWKSPSAVLQLDSRRTATTWLVSLDTRCESQLQAGLEQLRRRARTAST